MKVIFYGKHFYGVDKQCFNIKSATKENMEYVIRCKLEEWKKINRYSKAWYGLYI